MLLSIVLLILARTEEGFVQWYAATVFPLFPNTLGRLFSPLPVSAFELALALILLMLCYTVLKILFLLLIRSSRLKPFLSKSLRWIICMLSCSFLIFTLTGAINYSRAEFADSTDLKIQKADEQELVKLSLLLIEDTSKLLKQVPIDEEGLLSLEGLDIEQESIAAMKNLGEKYSALSGYYPNPKPVLLSKSMSYLGITGIFSPFTVEANYNKDVPSYIIPYTICHELAHLKGFMKEDEANFIAYLACRNSSSERLQYSGAVNALSYTLSALYKNVDSEMYAEVYSLIPEQIKGELEYNAIYWDKHTSTATHVAEKANNQYLKANAQTSGSQSYGAMVDLLLSDFHHILQGDVLL